MADNAQTKSRDRLPRPMTRAQQSYLAAVLACLAAVLACVAGTDPQAGSDRACPAPKRTPRTRPRSDTESAGKKIRNESAAPPLVERLI